MDIINFSRTLTFGWVIVSIVLECTNLLRGRPVASKLLWIAPCAIAVILIALAIRESLKDRSMRKENYVWETVFNVLLLLSLALPHLIFR